MIYLIYNQELDHVKIGYSAEPSKRLLELQTGNSCILKLIHIEEGSIKKEREIHSVLKNYKVYGEWFDYTKSKNKLKKVLNNLVDVELNYIQVYTTLNNIISKLESLIAVKLLFWSFEQIDKENIFRFNEAKIVEFNNSLEMNGSKTYNSRSVYIALKELLKEKIVLKLSNGVYQLNPLLIWNDTVNKRIDRIKYLENTKDIDYKITETITNETHKLQ